MKETAQVLKFKGKELITAPDINAGLEAVASDVASGDITPAEARKIQNEVNRRIKLVASALKTGQNSATLRSLADQAEVARNRIKGGAQNNHG
jgi:polyhydroxyalkanoate synthesis regulator phasin